MVLSLHPQLPSSTWQDACGSSSCAWGMSTSACEAPRLKDILNWEASEWRLFVVQSLSCVPPFEPREPQHARLPSSSYHVLNVCFWRLGFPDKKSACSVGDVSSIPGSGGFPWREKWQPTLVFLPGQSHGQRAWQATYSPWGGKELDTTEHVLGAGMGLWGGVAVWRIKEKNSPRLGK